jgi:hypothetical protein
VSSVILEVQLLPFPVQPVVRPTDILMVPEETKSTLLLCLDVLLAQAEGVLNESPHFLLFNFYFLISKHIHDTEFKLISSLQKF